MTEIVYDKHGNAHEIVDFNDDYTGSKLAMWLFLFTEVLLFGAIFIAFVTYFHDYTQDFVKAARNMSLWLGAANTIVLLVSACTLGFSVLHMKNNAIDQSKKFLYFTLGLAIVFLGIKALEWGIEFSHGIWPDSETLRTMNDGTNLYFGLYFTLTGLHAIHIIGGIVAMFWLLGKIKSGSVNAKQFVSLENFALYWDYVHLVWVFVVPLFYMIGFIDLGGN